MNYLDHASEIDLIGFRNEIALSSKKYLGVPFQYHWQSADCRNPMSTSGRCMSVGLGPDYFDCSGFAIRVITDVLGLPDVSWAEAMRHPEQMEEITESESPPSGVLEGDLIVFHPGACVHWLTRREGGGQLGEFTYTHVSHVAIALNALGELIHAPAYESSVVGINLMDVAAATPITVINPMRLVQAVFHNAQ